MAKAKTLEFANFVLTFGPGRVMADYLDEIVLPALFDTGLKRRYGETTYFFTGVERLDVGGKGKPESAVAGTFVKDTVLRASQVWNSAIGRIEPSSRKIPNAPSATFVLLLASHKLLYLHETPQAPGIEAFRGTLLRFLTLKWLDFINQQYATRRVSTDATTGRITKKALRTEYPPPELSIIPLGSESALVQAIDGFKRISGVRVTFTKVNAEADNDPFFAMMRSEQRAVGADSAVLIETKAGKQDSLNKIAVARQLASVAIEGNAQVKISGTSTGDLPLDISNDEIRLRVPMTNLPVQLDEKAKLLHHELVKAIASGTILVGKVDEQHANAIRQKFRS